MRAALAIRDWVRGEEHLQVRGGGERQERAGRRLGGARDKPQDGRSASAPARGTEEAEGPEQVCRPNYTVPAPTNFSGETLGYGAELALLRAVVKGETPPESDLASATATLRLVGGIAELAEAVE